MQYSAVHRPRRACLGARRRLTGAAWPTWRSWLLGVCALVAACPLSAAPFLQDSGPQGLVSMDAESFASNTPQGSDSWVVVAAPVPGFAGSGVMDTAPNDGTNNSTNFVTLSPRLDFQVQFLNAGTHYVWVRGLAAGGGHNSLHVGLNGQAVSSSTAITLNVTSNYVWSSGANTITIPSAGLHTINVWMREDGTQFDKLVLTTSAGYTPSGTGPAESPRTGGGNNAPIARDDAFSVTQDTNNNALAVLADNGSGVDTDPDNDPLTVTAVGTPSGSGTAVINGASDGLLYTPAPGFTGQETVSYTIGDGNGGFDSATVTVTVTAPVGGGGAFQQDGGAQGIVSMDAENFSSNTPQGSDSWVVVAAPVPGFAGSGVMDTVPNDGTNHSANFVTLSPRLDFQVQFLNAGTHYVWVRGLATGGGHNSLHVGLNGQAVSSSTAITLNVTSNYVWSSGANTITIPSAGLHTINVWMREDGTQFDKLVLTTSAGYTPTGAGPAESPRTGGGNNPPIARDDAFSVTLDTNNNALAVLVDNGSGADTDPDTDPLTVTAVGSPSGSGTAVINGASDGVLYTPAPGFTGQETFSYTIGDGNGGFDSATVTVTVTAIGGGNNPPIARNDAVSVTQDTHDNALAVLVDNGSGADTDPDVDPLTVTAVGTPSGSGTAVINGANDGVLYTPAAGFIGQETFSYTIGDGNGGFDSATVTVVVIAPVGGGGAFQQDGGAQGLVSMDAENFASNTPQGSDSWVTVATPAPGFAGTGVMDTVPNDGTNQSANFVTLSPRLDFQVQFLNAGTHYVWVRGLATGGGHNSLHVGLNGQAVSSSTAITLNVTSNYVWSSGANTITIPSAGLHTINVWMREDGTQFDKLVLTTSAGYTPSGVGPAESPRSTSCVVFPSITISTPEVGHLQTSGALAVDTLTCSAASLPPGWGVKFLRDGGLSQGGDESFDYSAPFSASFGGPGIGEHQLEAQIVDASGARVPGARTQHQINRVGVGDYYVAIGDSITFGVGDDIAGDNASADGRNDGGGFTPILNDLLTTQRVRPHTVENEGVPGDTSAGGLLALPSVLTQHPEAQRYLVKYGMNDAKPFLPVPSGLGLTACDAGYPGTFKDNMLRMVNLIQASGRALIIAKINVALADGAGATELYPDPDQGARSLLIKDFNLVIDELADNPVNGLTVAGPDFYTYFLANYGAEYSDPIHPNGLGYQSMASLWSAVSPWTAPPPGTPPSVSCPP